MKKLLSMLSAMTLIGTTSTSVVACGEGEKPTPPNPDTKTDLIKYNYSIKWFKFSCWYN